MPSNQVDPSVATGRRSQPPIARQEHRVEGFGQRDIGRVIGGEVVSQGPYPRQEQPVRIALHGKVGEISQGGLTSITADIAMGGVTPDNLGDFDIQQMLRMQRLPRSEYLRLDRPCRRRAQKQIYQRRRITCPWAWAQRPDIDLLAVTRYKIGR